MLLILIRNTRTRYAFHCTLVEKDPFVGERKLASVTESLNRCMLELIFPLSVTRSGICLMGTPVSWTWKDDRKKEYVENYLRQVLLSGEEIRLEITRPVPDLPGYPYVNHNAYARRENVGSVIKVEKEQNEGDG